MHFISRGIPKLKSGNRLLPLKINPQSNETDNHNHLHGVSDGFVERMHPNGGDAFPKDEREKRISAHNAVTRPAHEHPEALNRDEFVKTHYAGDAILMPPNAPVARGTGGDHYRLRIMASRNQISHER